jgi:iron(III) transport system substrate-binding protein
MTDRFKGTGLLGRRELIIGGLAAGTVGALARPAIAQGAASPDRPNLDKARSETLTVWHGDQEEDVVNFLAKFTAATGVQTKQLRLLPGAALPRLQAELRANRSDADVYLCSDAGLMDQLRAQGHLLRYESPEYAAYPKEFVSDPVGYWATYYVYFGAMMYSPKFVEEATAPKTWMDLLDPQWAGQIGFQNSSAGSQYNQWYLLREVVPADYWTRLAAQKPRGSASSTQIVNDIHGGKLKIGGKVNHFQYVKAMRQGLPAKAVFPPEGTPTGNAAVGIISATKRPDAAKVFMDYILSKEGQLAFNTIQGSPSARADVKVQDVPSMSELKVLIAKDFADYQSSKRHAEFTALWNKVLGV